MDITSPRSTSTTGFNLDDDEFFNGRCAEVYITNKGKFFIGCLLCEEKFDDFNVLKLHIEEMHNFECSPIIMQNVKEEYIVFDECVSNIDYEEFDDNTQVSEALSSVDDNEEISNEFETITENPIEKEVWSITPCKFEAENEVTSTAEEPNETILLENISFSNDDDEDNLTLSKAEDDLEMTEDNIFPFESIKEIEDEEFDSTVVKKKKLARRITKKSLQAKRNRPNNSNSERIHICPICSFAFTDKSNLNAHIRRHGDERKYACDQCSKRFFTRTELETHVRYHTGERPYICSACGKGCLTAGELNVHERRHTNDRRYKCEYCEKTFYNNKHLKDHVVSHTQERKHVCNICNSRFLRRKSLKSHIKIHENKREYVCNICGNAYNQRPALSIHIKSKHGVHLHKPDLD